MTDRVQIRNRVFYQLKPYIPRSLQIWLRGKMARRSRAAYAHVWPIYEKAGKLPAGWPGWPDQKQFALVLMHDVESAVGQQRCAQLLDLEQERAFCSSFNFVPERYKVLPEVRQLVTANGFEVGVHGLKHDGKLFQSRDMFLARAQKINAYLAAWNAVGFCSPASHHNLTWIHDLNVEYDSSTFDTDPFEPQSDGVETIFPFWVRSPSIQAGYVELPYTLPQDFTLFILLKEKKIDIWKRKLDWIAEQGGMALLITHPDYMNFTSGPCALEEYPVAYYLGFLDYVRTTYKDHFWHALPKEVAAFVKSRSPGAQQI